MKYTCLNIQGSFISEEILQKIENAEAVGQQAKDFGFDSDTNLRREIEYAWSRIKLDWKHFSGQIEKLPASDPYGTSVTRKWMLGFFNTLGFDLTLQRSSLQGDNRQSYSISHTCESLDGLPVHIVGFHDPSHPEKNTLDIRSGGGTSRLSPHATIQEYLNVTEHLYGLTTNGLVLRLLRDSGRLVKMTFIEFDIRRMLEEDKYSEFTLLFRLLHASRFPKSKQETESCLLEKYYIESIESGNRIRDGLSNAVKEALLKLGNGLLKHPDNEHLRQKILNKGLTPEGFYKQLLRLVYRILFLMVIEERDLIYNPEDKSPEILRKRKIYFDFYSMSRLRKMSKLRFLYESQFSDLWQGLMTTLRLFEENGGGTKLGIQPLDGELFSNSSIKDLSECHLNNSYLLHSIQSLNVFEDENCNLVYVNYRALDVEELGSVYEGLLELHPVIENIETSNPENISFIFHEGTERKTTGSYYTRPDLVNELIKSALIPVIKERLKKNAGNREAQEAALLDLKVCDPATGSGHMLLAAARTIAWELACLRSGETNPSPPVYRTCLREVIQHCIYGVDLNPEAVELCKLSLWLESHCSGKPLSFLDHKIRCGNSLVGVTDLSVLRKGIPDNAFNPVTGDDRDVCRELKRANSEFRRTGQYSLYDTARTVEEISSLSAEYNSLEEINQDDLKSVKRVQHKFENFRRDRRWLNDCTACNIWTSAFFYTYTPESRQSAPSSERLQLFLQSPAAAYGPMIGKADALALEHRFFHWPLEFPDVFARGGFDVMLGNPPWERIKLQQQEFFAIRDRIIAEAPNAAARNRMINNLSQTNPLLYGEYQKALHSSDAAGKFLRDSGRYLLTAVGDINTYSVFAETFYSLIRKTGRAGFIVPTGIATDDSNKAFFGNLIEKNRLISLFDFENREAIFPDVHRSYKFCLLTISGEDCGVAQPQFGFFLTRVEHLQDKMRIFSLTRHDFIRLNPNTKTCPVFRTRVDAELTTRIYKNVPVLVNETTGENPWGISFMRMFDMSTDSHLFRTRDQLEAEGFILKGNRMVRGSEVWLPLYEAKLIYQYNHKYSTFAGAKERNETLNVADFELKNSYYTVLTWYFLKSEEVYNRIIDYAPSFLMGYRDITNSTNERTSIFSLIPYSATTGINLTFLKENAIKKALFLSIWNSIVFDYFVRQKVGGTHLSQNYTKQFPVITPKYLSNYMTLFILLRVIELAYTSWDIKAFADDVWKESDTDLRAAIHKHWEENKAATGGHAWAPPDWCDIDPDGCPLPPFKWDEERRAVLKAELDAIYAKLYGLTYDELRYILDPQDVYGPGFPGETFRVLKEKEIRQYGEYRTRRLVLEAWERMNNTE